MPSFTYTILVSVVVFIWYRADAVHFDWFLTDPLGEVSNKIEIL